MVTDNTHEVEDEEEEDALSWQEMYPYAMKLSPGDVVFLDVSEVAEKLGADAFQLTQEDGLFYMKDGQWHQMPLVSTNKRVAKLKPA